MEEQHKSAGQDIKNKVLKWGKVVESLITV